MTDLSLVPKVGCTSVLNEEVRKDVVRDDEEEEEKNGL